MPLPFLGFGFALMPRMFATWLQEPDFKLFGLLCLNNLFYFGALILLIVMLAQRSAVGPNRYGADMQVRDFGDARARWGY